MFNVGGGEIFVILLVALIVLGPQRLPGAVRQAGQLLGELRKMSTGFQQEMKSAFDEVDAAEPPTKPISAPMATDPSTQDAVTKPEPDGDDQDRG
jgi:Tat protein translocase TatB subunit